MAFSYGDGLFVRRFGGKGRREILPLGAFEQDFGCRLEPKQIRSPLRSTGALARITGPSLQNGLKNSHFHLPLSIFYIVGRRDNGFAGERSASLSRILDAETKQ